MVEPTWEFLGQVLGEKLAWWMQIRAYTLDRYPNISEVWRFYNDGKQWLYRLMHKKNTICWIAVMADTFRVTFYFPKKAEALIAGSSLPGAVKEEFLNARSYGRIQPITVRMEDASAVELVRQLVDLKLALK